METFRFHDVSNMQYTPWSEWSRRRSRSSWSVTKASTVSCRCVMAVKSTSGCVSHTYR